jgi:hypothetical protein
MEKYHAIPELAKITGESIAVWRKRVYRREIESVRCGRNVRVSGAALQSWLQARTVPSKAAHA